jgi:hypothetical protein
MPKVGFNPMTSAFDGQDSARNRPSGHQSAIPVVQIINQISNTEAIF